MSVTQRDGLASTQTPGAASRRHRGIRQFKGVEYNYVGWARDVVEWFNSAFFDKTQKETVIFIWSFQCRLVEGKEFCAPVKCGSGRSIKFNGLNGYPPLPISPRAPATTEREVGVPPVQNMCGGGAAGQLRSRGCEEGEQGDMGVQGSESSPCCTLSHDIKYFHCIPSGAHLGITKTTHKITQDYCW
ncbi:hypothetical protein J437_LFUL016232, partial [Ladona fulva]